MDSCNCAWKKKQLQYQVLTCFFFFFSFSIAPMLSILPYLSKIILSSYVLFYQPLTIFSFINNVLDERIRNFKNYSEMPNHFYQREKNLLRFKKCVYSFIYSFSTFLWLQIWGQIIGNWGVKEKQAMSQAIKKAHGGRQTLMQMQLQ